MGKIDVVVPSSNCKSIYCYPCIDLRSYASSAAVDAEPSLLIQLLNNEEILLDNDAPIIETPTELLDEKLPLEMRIDIEED